MKLGKPTLDSTTIASTGTATVSVTVTNTGERAGTEVVQMYVHPKVSSVVQPVLRLAGFERVTLEAGETRTVHFPAGPEQLAIWNARMLRSTASRMRAVTGRPFSTLDTRIAETPACAATLWIVTTGRGEPDVLLMTS